MYNLDIIFNPDFKKIIKNNPQFKKDLNKFKEEYEKPITVINKENLKKNLENYINWYNYSLIEQYYNDPKIDIIYYMEDDYKYTDFMLNNKEFTYLLLTYSDYWLNLWQTSNTIFKSNIIKELYNKRKELNNPTVNKAFEKFKNYNNNSFNDRMEVELDFSFLTNYICQDKLFKDLNICSDDNINLINYYYSQRRKYKFKLIDKIDDNYYTLFNLLYLININKNVCNVKNLLYNTNINDIQNDLDILILFPDSRYILLTNPREIFNIDAVKVNVNKKLKEFIKKCLNKFIILPVTIIVQDSFHANILIYNPNTKEVEIFDPQEEHTNNIDFIYKKMVEKLFSSNIKYVPQKEYITEHIQDLQEKEFCSIEIGHCASWTTWYVEQRLKYPNLTAKQAFNKIYKDLIENNKSYTSYDKYAVWGVVKPQKVDKTEDPLKLSKYIANYVQYIKKQRKTVIDKADIQPEIKELLRKEWNL